MLIIKFSPRRGYTVCWASKVHGPYSFAAFKNVLRQKKCLPSPPITSPFPLGSLPDSSLDSSRDVLDDLEGRRSRSFPRSRKRNEGLAFSDSREWNQTLAFHFADFCNGCGRVMKKGASYPIMSGLLPSSYILLESYY